MPAPIVDVQGVAGQTKAQLVLIVEDEQCSRRALATLLGDSGFSVQTVATGEEALRMLRRTGYPDIVLVDCKLPGMSGLELISRMRREGPPVSIILITADQLTGERQMIFEQHIRYLQKPINFDHLLFVIDSQTGWGASPGPG